MECVKEDEKQQDSATIRTSLGESFNQVATDPEWIKSQQDDAEKNLKKDENNS